MENYEEYFKIAKIYTNVHAGKSKKSNDEDNNKNDNTKSNCNTNVNNNEQINKGNNKIKVIGQFTYFINSNLFL